MSYKDLRSVEIKGFKSIKHQEVSIKDMNVLIGQNGAGKSNFISVFKFLRNVIERRLKNTSLKASAENLLYYGSKETESIYFGLDFKPNMYDITLQPTDNDALIIASEHIGFWASGYDRPYMEAATLSEDESNLPKVAKTKRMAEHVLRVLKDWRVYHFHDTSDTAGLKKYGSVADNKFLFEDASNLAAFLYLMRDTEAEYYERIVKTIQLVIPFFKDFILEPNRRNEENIRLEWMDNFSDRIFTANQLSDGSVRFICMATLLLQKNLPRLILLDEPELGLHPTAITILAGLLKKASKRTQVIISTQSVSLVNEFDPEDILVVEKDEAETVFKRLDSSALESWLDSYSLGDLWDKNIIGGKP